MDRLRVAVVGTGISGLVCAHHLHRRHDLTVFESADYVGGHTHTVRVDLADETHDVDTGFIVYNERTYPELTALLAELGVASQPSDMSFSVSARDGSFEYRATTLATLYAQRSNMLRPAFHRMLLDIIRFKHHARRLLEQPNAGPTLGEFLARGRYGRMLMDHYLVPLGASLWSADPTRFTEFPATTFARFFDRHGLLSFGNQPQWRTVTGGAARYVDALVQPFRHRIRLSAPVDKIVRRTDGVEVHGQRTGLERFDAVILANHSDQALELLGDPSPAERAVLGAIAYQPNVATLHTDASVLPRRRRAWASWNYHLPSGTARRAAVTYHMNSLQSLRSREEICITLNREDDIDPAKVLGRYEYDHPVFDLAAVAAQRRRDEIQGRNRTWFCGAYWGYGFHEDGVRSALDVCRRLS